MVREKVGFVQRLLASIGKRLLWWRAEKMDLYVLALMARETVLKYQELLDGNLEAAVNTLKVQFAESAKTYLRNFMNQLKLVVSKDLNDMEFMSEVSLWSILGPKFREFFAPSKYLPAGDPINPYNNPCFVSISPKCVLCSVIQDLDMEKYRDLDYGAIISYALGSLIEIIMEYVGHNYRIEVKETRCFLRGDPYSEMVYLVHEKNE
ncbi:MAG: hypothetical protein EU536_00280 [Promethearchaeota archaeon]|nr:MAG: hypothetical protein EU536_00280 [Candidatus Lokiarchaeota archaeon]